MAAKFEEGRERCGWHSPDWRVHDYREHWVGVAPYNLREQAGMAKSGRRGGLKIHWRQLRAGSNPAPGTDPSYGFLTFQMVPKAQVRGLLSRTHLTAEPSLHNRFRSFLCFIEFVIVRRSFTPVWDEMWDDLESPFDKSDSCRRSVRQKTGKTLRRPRALPADPGVGIQELGTQNDCYRQTTGPRFGWLSNVLPCRSESESR